MKFRSWYRSHDYEVLIAFVISVAFALVALWVCVVLTGCASESGRPADPVAPRTLPTAGLPPLPVPSTNQIRLKSRAAPQPPPRSVTNLLVIWETPGEFGSVLAASGRTHTNWSYLFTWIEELNQGGSWYRRTAYATPQATNRAVIANTNRAGMLRAVYGWP